MRAAKFIGPFSPPRRFSVDEIAKAFGVPPAVLREPDPFIAARTLIEEGDRESMKAAVARLTGLAESCFEITDAEVPDLPGQFSATILLSGTMGQGVIWDEIGPRETCSTCGRSEGLFESVPECRGASPGECRFSLRRVE